MALKHGYRSGLEHKISIYLDEHKVKYSYEDIKIEWEDLAYRTYTPDFVLYNGIRYGFKYYDRIIPEDWLKEKGKNKHPKFIKFGGTKVKRR